MMRIPDAEVDIAAHVIDSHDAAEALAQALAFAPNGRPRELSLRTFLIACYLAISEAASFKATVIYRVLTEAISIDKQWDLGVRVRNSEGAVEVIPKSRVDYLTKTITKRLVWTTAGAERFKLDIDEEEMNRRRTAHMRALNALLDGSLIDGGTGWYALDGSNHWSWGKARGSFHDDKDVRAQEDVHDEVIERTPDEVADMAVEGTAGEPGTAEAGTTKTRPVKDTSYDFDAAIGSKTSKSGRRESFFGYVIDTATPVSPPDQPTGPVVIERLVVSPASTDVVAPSLEMLDSIVDKGGRVTDIVVDRHYSYKKVNRWADELRERGVTQHFDLRADEQGFKDLNGTRLAAGWLHCPATPDHLGTITRPGPGASQKERDDFRRQIDERWSWALDRDERTNHNGRSRWTCPDVAGKRGCALRPDSVAVAEAAGLPIVNDPPDAATAPACCTNKSGKITAYADELRKHEQTHYWGSEAWELAYNLRTYVEGLFGSLKNPDTEDVRRGFTKFVGLPLVSLGVTLAAAVCNVRHQRRYWEDRDGKPDHPLLAKAAPSRGWVEITADQEAAVDKHHAPSSTDNDAEPRRADRDDQSTKPVTS